MAGIFDLPDDGTRLLDKEIKGEEEYNASLRAKKNDENNDIFVDGGLGFSDDEAEEGGDTVGELSKPMGFKSKSPIDASIFWRSRVTSFTAYGLRSTSGLNCGN